MLLEDLYQRLSYGELNNLALSGDGSGTIVEEARPRVILYANEALIRLYSTFVLRTDSVVIQLEGHITMYHLLPRFCYSQRNISTEPYLYIADLDDEPYENDLIKILTVFDGDGCELPLNDSENSRSVFTPQAQVLQVPWAESDKHLSLLYQAKHAVLPDGDPHAIIELPEVLHGALTAFIAYKVYSHMNTAEASNKAAEHMSVFASICEDALTKDLVSTSILPSNTRFHKRGWI